MKEQFKDFEIPLGAKDSELCGWEYSIPEGMEATIVDNKIRGEAYIDGAYRDIWSTEEIEYGRDYEVYATYKDGTEILYVDGVEQARYEGLGLSEKEAKNLQDFQVQQNSNWFVDATIEDQKADAMIVDIDQ